jgi:diaminohydroxyphosphoribosylaminopyrimidine deaminase/5-amino-6-(5-phosphoribosylamino)uracil reductase
MQRCLELARMGAGHVAPNPMVGAVLVHEDRIIGEGYHEQYGQAHAEVNCINSVKAGDVDLVPSSTLYVSLEPCVHFGITPPCTDLVIFNNIPEVVIACVDIFAAVNGKGIEKLRSAGINVITGVLEKEAIELNKRFFTFHQKQRPYVILKWAESSDKMIGKGGERVLISNEASNRLVHKWRSEEAAIMVGTNTALADDPALTTRLWPGKDPLRIVIDMDLKLPPSLHLFDKSVKTIIFNGQKNEEGKMLVFIKINKEENILQQVLQALHKMKVQSVMVEGGAKLLQSFIDEGLWDEARIISNKQLAIGNGVSAPQLSANTIVNTEKIGENIITIHIPTT